jgi:O-antigen/teichoic acid export membrane protein
LISKNFIKGSLLYTLSGALPMASAIILLPLYVLYLPPTLYGVLAVCLAFSVLIQIVVTYSFDTSLYIHYHELKNEPDKLAVFISSSFAFIILLGIVVTAILTATGEVIFRLVPDTKIAFYPYGFISVIIGVFQAIFRVHGNLLQTREQAGTFTVSNVALFFLIASTTVIGLKLYPGTLFGPLGGRLLSGFVMAAWAIARIVKRYGVHLKNPWKIVSFHFNLFSFFYQIQQWLINYFDRFLLLFFLPLSAVGVYDFAIKALVAIEILMNGLHGTIYPRIIKRLTSQQEKKSSPEVNRYYYGLISVVMVLICLSIFALPIAIDLFVKKSTYSQSIQYLPFLALIFMFRAMRFYFAVPFSIYKYMQQLTVISFVASSVKILLMIFLIKKYEIYGVVIAAYAASVIEISLLWYFIKTKYAMDFNWFKLIGAPLLLMGVVLICEPLVGHFYPVWVHFGYGIFCGAMLLLAYRNELKLLSSLRS